MLINKGLQKCINHEIPMNILSRSSGMNFFSLNEETGHLKNEYVSLPI